METSCNNKHELNCWKNNFKNFKGLNPDSIIQTKKLRIKTIELNEFFTRIDFIYRSSTIYENGGWISIEPLTYIKIIGSEQKYYLINAINIPIAPNKHFFNKQDERFTYSLIFPAIPNTTREIDIIERLEVGNYFNFYSVNFSSWMNIVHPLDFKLSNN
jgi:hypothetical protein